MLGFALAEDLPSAAIVAARLLGESEDAGVLYAHNPQSSALVRALAHPSRELRFAVLRQSCGSIRVRLTQRARRPRRLIIARSTGYPKALVGAAVETEAGRIAGLLAEQGYEPDTATDAAGMLRMARPRAITK